MHLQRHDSKAALIEELSRAESPSLLLGGEGETPTEWYSVEITTPCPLVIGIMMAGHGVVPGLFLLPENLLLVGYNQELVTIDLERSAVRTRSQLIGGAFYEFIEVGDAGVLAVSETELLSLSRKGEVRWRLATEILVEWKVIGSQITFREFLQERVHRIDFETGELG